MLNKCDGCLQCEKTNTCKHKDGVDLTRTTEFKNIDPEIFMRDQREKQILDGIEGQED